MPEYIYKLIDPITQETRYIGITQSLKLRFRAHRGGYGTNSLESAWLKDLLERGLRPTIIMIDTAENREQAREKERYWIQHYLAKGANLTNILGVNHNARRESQYTKRQRRFFSILDQQWKKYQQQIVPMFAHWSAKEKFDDFVGTLAYSFPSKRDLIPLWVENKRKELNLL